MALFGSLGRSGYLERSLSPVEAASAVLLGVVASDGDISDEEVQTFNTMATHHPIFRNQSDVNFRKMIDDQFAVLKKNGWEALFDRGALLLPSTFANTVFVLAVDFVLSDGVVEETEEYLIDKLRKALSVSDDIVQATIQIMSIKYALGKP